MSLTVLITGSNKGIGLETARQLLRLGHAVVLSGRDEKRLGEAVALLEKEGLQPGLLVMDVGNRDSIAAAVKEFSRLYQKLDVLINNAAIALKGDHDLSSADPALVEETMRINAYGPLWVTQAFLPILSTPARVIMVSSGGGSMTDEVEGWSPVYCASKTLLNGLTRQLAFSLKSRRVSVNALCPGWVKTDMGGNGATRTVAKGAETPVWLATEAPVALTGKFFRDRKEIPW